MKVELRARPVAYFMLSRSNLELLKQCAKLHYDGACQRTLDRAGAPLRNLTIEATKNGLLTQWEMQFEYAEEQSLDGIEVSVTSDQADLLAKVTEMWVHQQYGDKTGDVQALHKFFYDLIGHCNVAYGVWKRELEL